MIRPPIPDAAVPETLARYDADGFDIALRVRRGDGPCGDDVHELIVNGMFAMDSVDASSELALADLVPADAGTVLVGGLGLGFTTIRLLQRTTARIEVVELSGALLGWARDGATPQLGRVASDPRVTLVEADVADLLRAGRQWDAVLLDVDNGPDFLIHEHNAVLYEDDLLAAAFASTAPGGLLAIWSEGVSDQLLHRLRHLSPTAFLQVVTVERDGHDVRYGLHALRRPDADA